MIAKRNTVILTDSKAIKAVYSTARTFRLVEQCRDALNSLGGTIKLILPWISRHRNMEGNG